MFERDDLDLSDIIDVSLEEIQSGKSSLEDVLKQHPDLAPIIRPELEIALWLAASETEVAPRPSFIRASRKRVVERVREESVGLTRKRGFFGLAFPAFNWQPVAALVLAVFLFFSVSLLLNAAHDTIPGQSLYSVKRIHEQVQFGVTFSETARVMLTTEFSENRLDEIDALLEQGNPAAAAELFDDFQLEVTRTVNLLNAVDENHPQAKLETAQAVQIELSKQAQQLEEIRAGAPQEVVAGLDQAHTLALQGAKLAVEVEDAVIRSTATPVPTTIVPSATNTATVTKTPVPPTNTEEPEPQVTPGVTQPGENTQPGVGPVTATPTKQPKVTNTPRPTNENRPTQKPPKDNVVPTEKPPKEEQPPPADSGPPKDDKPTREEKPTKDNSD